MKKLIILLFLFVSVAASAQRWQNFIGHVPNNFTTDKAINFKFLPRPVVSSAIMFTPDPVLGYQTAPFTGVGIGIALQHFKTVEGLPYNDYGFSLIMFTQVNDKAAICPAIGFNTLEFVNMGIGYNLGVERIFLFLGGTYSFN